MPLLSAPDIPPKLPLEPLASIDSVPPPPAPRPAPPPPGISALIFLAQGDLVFSCSCSSSDHAEDSFLFQKSEAAKAGLSRKSTIPAAEALRRRFRRDCSG